MIRKILIFSVLLLVASPWLRGQTGGIKVTPGQKALYADSTEKKDYPYKLPLLGAKAAAKGFNLPLPLGVMVNGYFGSQAVNVSDLQIGINGGSMIDLDDIVQFSSVKANINNVNFRPDVWVLPFLNVYGIVAFSKAKTKVEMSKPFSFSTEADFQGITYGFGATASAGIFGFFVTTDFNSTWSKLSNLDNAVNAMTLSPRVGRLFHFHKKPESNVGLWLGAVHYILKGSTTGTIDLSKIYTPSGDLRQKVVDFESTITGSTPKDIAERDLCDKLIRGIDDLNARISDATIRYSLKKRPTHPWNMIVGAQYQINNHFILRNEWTILGGHTSCMLSFNYRFGL